MIHFIPRLWLTQQLKSEIICTNAILHLAYDLDEKFQTFN